MRNSCSKQHKARSREEYTFAKPTKSTHYVRTFAKLRDEVIALLDAVTECSGTGFNAESIEGRRNAMHTLRHNSLSNAF